MPIKTTSTTIGENNIHAVSYSPEEKLHNTPIVLVHGSWGGTWMYQNYATYFAERGFNVHALDLRGHGESGGSVEEATMDDYENDVATAVEGLGLKRPIVIGHSMGGLVVLMYARDHEVSALVPINPSPSIEVTGESHDKEYKSAYTPQDAGMPEDPEHVMKVLTDFDKETLMFLKKHLGLESGTARSQRKKGVSVPKENITAPTLFVGAEIGEDLPGFGIGIETARAMAQYYDADVHEIKGASHPGALIGEYWENGASHIYQWLIDNITTH